MGSRRQLWRPGSNWCNDYSWSVSREEVIKSLFQLEQPLNPAEYHGFWMKVDQISEKETNLMSGYQGSQEPFLDLLVNHTVNTNFLALSSYSEFEVDYRHIKIGKKTSLLFLCFGHWNMPFFRSRKLCNFGHSSAVIRGSKGLLFQPCSFSYWRGLPFVLVSHVRAGCGNPERLHKA